MPTLEPVPAPLFSLELTLHSGQVFHWQRAGEGYAGAIGEVPVYVEQRGEILSVTRGTGELVARYFALDHPLAEVYATFPQDEPMAAALAVCRGLRIIRQPPWECLATFITSSLKQVAHIAQISHLLRRRFGRPLGKTGGLEQFAYPEPGQIAALDEAALRACGLGFRAKPLLATARAVVAAGGAESLAAIGALTRQEALQALCRFPGVGPKVANCVLLFAYERLDAFPIDVWIERVLREQYFRGKRKVTARRLNVFSETYFGAYGGYAQQYLFHRARGAGRKGKAVAGESQPG